MGNLSQSYGASPAIWDHTICAAAISRNTSNIFGADISQWLPKMSIKSCSLMFLLPLMSLLKETHRHCWDIGKMKLERCKDNVECKLMNL